MFGEAIGMTIILMIYSKIIQADSKNAVANLVGWVLLLTTIIAWLLWLAFLIGGYDV